MKPWLVMVTGEPGSGKTTLALALSAALRVPNFARDLVRGGMLATQGAWTNAMTGVSPRETAVEAHVQIIEKAAALGVSAVIEFMVTPARLDAMQRICEAANVLVIVVSSDDARARAISRDLADPFFNRPDVLAALGFASVDAFVSGSGRDRMRDEMITDFELPTLRVSTDDGYAPSLDAIVDWVIEQTR